jgi:hypothetical protein
MSIFWVTEQPGGSAMETNPAWQWLLGWLTIWRKDTHLWKFGGKSAKLLWLYSADKYCEFLRNKNKTWNQREHTPFCVTLKKRSHPHPHPGFPHPVSLLANKSKNM